MATHLDRAAKVASDGFGAINEPLQRGAGRRRGRHRLPANAVRDDLSVYKPGKSTEADEKAMREFAQRITAAANEPEAADTTVRNELSATLADLRADIHQRGRAGGGDRAGRMPGIS